MVLVGHVTKDGQIAGPRVVEHMVDTVLYFEGERGHQFRILRAVKNRFGPADEIGVFEMTGAGLAEVANPSALFLSERDAATSGSAVFAGVEGTRPLLVEIQALVAPAALGTARRTVVGWDGGRLAMRPRRARSRAAASASARSTSTSTSPAACASPSPPPTSPSPRRWSPPARTSPCPATRWSSARSASPARCAPPPRPKRGCARRRSSASPPPTRPPRRRPRPVTASTIHPVADLGAFMDKCFGTIDR